MNLHREDGRSRPSPPAPLFLPGAILAVAAGALHASRLAWVCDDAFISFRYALNLTRGEGLVFNAGEQVEGFTNLLWTLLVALALELRLDPERFAVAAGVAFHAGTIALLAFHAHGTRREGTRLALPAAALLAASLPDLAVYATSGLETSLFTFLAFAAFVALSLGRGARAAGGAGALLALAALARPDGLLFAAAAAPFVAWRMTPRIRSTAAFVGAFAVLWGPATIARVAYFGSFFPNTYYAKSASLAWWEQGFRYASLYFERYPLLALALPLALLSLLAPARDPEGAREAARGRGPIPRALLAAAFAVTYVLYVTRVGGDFMFGRFLVPATPFLLVLLEAGPFARVRRACVQCALAAGAAALLLTAPSPVGADEGRTWGIGDERAFYATHPVVGADAGRARGEALRPFFAGLPIRIAFLGGEARLVFYADPAFALECATGLTDSWIARQPLARRGRVGHEKTPPPAYVLGERKSLLAFHPLAGEILGLDREIPFVPISFGAVNGRLLRWDPQLVTRLRSRGARTIDFPAYLDGYIDSMDSLPLDRVREDFGRFSRFYFDGVPDEARRRPFLERLRPSPAVAR